MVEALIVHFTDGNKAQFAKILGVSPQTISAWIARSTFDSELIYTKCRYINPAWLLTGKGNMLVSSEPFSDTPPQTDRKDGNKDNKNIPYSQAKNEKTSNAVEATAFLSYMEKKDEAIKEKDAIIEQKNQEITALKCQVTRLEGENQHLIDELDRIREDRTQQPTVNPPSTATPTSQPSDTPRSHTA